MIFQDHLVLSLAKLTTLYQSIMNNNNNNDTIYTEFVLYSIKLSNLQIGSSDIKTSPTGLTVETSGVSIDGSADWKYHNNGWWAYNKWFES